MLVVLLLILGLSVPVIAEAQIACSNLGGGTTYCDGPRGSTSITELSRGQGVIQTDRETIPYTIIGGDRRRSTYDSTPLTELEPLPSYGESYSSPSYRSGSSLSDSPSFEQREAIRESGRIPW